MPRTIPEQYFENKLEQSRIKQAILEAMPTGVYYHNLILALTELLARAVEEAYKEEVYTKHAPPTPPNARSE